MHALCMHFDRTLCVPQCVERGFGCSVSSTSIPSSRGLEGRVVDLDVAGSLARRLRNLERSAIRVACKKIAIPEPSKRIFSASRRRPKKMNRAPLRPRKARKAIEKTGACPRARARRDLNARGSRTLRENGNELANELGVKPATDHDADPADEQLHALSRCRSDDGAWSDNARVQRPAPEQPSASSPNTSAPTRCSRVPPQTLVPSSRSAETLRLVPPKPLRRPSCARAWLHQSRRERTGLTQDTQTVSGLSAAETCRRRGTVRSSVNRTSVSGGATWGLMAPTATTWAVSTLSRCASSTAGRLAGSDEEIRPMPCWVSSSDWRSTSSDPTLSGLSPPSQVLLQQYRQISEGQFASKCLRTRALWLPSRESVQRIISIMAPLPRWSQQALTDCRLRRRTARRSCSEHYASHLSRFSPILFRGDEHWVSVSRSGVNHGSEELRQESVSTSKKSRVS